MLLLPLAFAITSASSLSPTYLRCEYLTNPIGIEETRPRLSWVDTSSERGARQTAYRIVVTQDEYPVRYDHAPMLWDSGKVNSDQSTQIVYGGRTLRTGTVAHWSVEVWDEKGRLTESHDRAFWTMGLLKKSDWKAQWIGRSTSKSAIENLNGASWIWFPETLANGDMPKGSVYFDKQFNVDVTDKVVSAVLDISADDHYALTLNGSTAGKGDGWETIHRVNLKPLIKPGANELVIQGINDVGKAGVAAVIRIRYQSGKTDTLVTDSTWTAAKNLGDTWGLPLVLGEVGIAPWGIPRSPIFNGPAPYLRKRFAVKSPVVRATVYASALGLYKLYIDGKPVSHDELRPGWTDYNKRVQYEGYDVTSWLTPGNHAIGMVLGNGWYCGRVGWTMGHNYGEQPLGLVQLEMAHADGSIDRVVTDSTWKAGIGPIVSDDLLDGESYDARKEKLGWSTASFADSGWGAPVAKPLSNIELNAQQSPSVQELQELHPQSIKENPKGSFIFDLGQNMVGWARLRVHGPAGSEVRLRFAEMLNPDGSIYVTNLRSAKATDSYMLKGSGEEVYEPSFTFHGFRYVEVTGFPGTPTKQTITGIVEGSNNPKAGEFACSSAMVTKLSQNIFWGQRGNYVDVPTDCPQRDERLGWMGDAQIFARTATYDNDTAAFMTKWTRDVQDAQSAAGGFSDVSPRLVDNSDGAPAWGDAGVIVPWTIYQAYGDKRILAVHYKSMAKWISYIDSVNPNHLWVKRSNANFGDWLNVQDDTPREVLATAYFAHSTDLLARSAEILGYSADATKYRALLEKIKEAFNKAFVNTEGKIRGDTQTDYVLGLWFGLLSPQEDSIAIKRLADLILIERKGHLSTGFVGVGYLCPTLTAFGRPDIAYKLLNNDTYPSWGYSIRQGATTIWERWDGWRNDKGFQDPGMNSFNHYSLGSVGEWMYNYILGIDMDPKDPGFHHVIIHALPGGGLTWAQGSLNTIHGLVKTAWKLDGDKSLTFDVTIPANTTASIYLPKTVGGKWTESGKDLGAAPGIRRTGAMTDYYSPTYELASGTYHFKSVR